MGFILAFCDKSYEVTIMLIVKMIFTIACYLIPIIVIIATIINLFKPITSGKDEELKDNFKIGVRRIIAGLVVMMIPTVLSYVFNNFTNGDKVDFLTCFNTASKERIEALKAKEEAEEEAARKKQEAEDERTLRAAYEADQKNRDKNKQTFEEWKKERANRGESAGAANSVSDKTDYGNGTLNVTQVVDTNINNPDSGLGDGRNKYRAVQTAAYTGKYVVYGQNKNYGSIDSSSKGGRICWSNLSTGEQVKCVEIGPEGGHMDGIAYDNDRGMVLKTAGGKLLQLDNKKMEIAGYANIPETSNGITYVPKIHSIVQYSGKSLKFYKYNNSNNTYEHYKTVGLENCDVESMQDIGTDGTNIFIADSAPGSSKENLYTYSLDGKRLEKHEFGSGFGRMSSEVESAFGDNEGNLYLACPQGIAKVQNYRANKIGLPTK